MICTGWTASCSSKRSSSTALASWAKTEKFTPFASGVAPNGWAWPGSTWKLRAFPGCGRRAEGVATSREVIKRLRSVVESPGCREPRKLCEVPGSEDLGKNGEIHRLHGSLRDAQMKMM